VPTGAVEGLGGSGGSGGIGRNTKRITGGERKRRKKIRLRGRGSKNSRYEIFANIRVRITIILISYVTYRH
jgi:hypothetical protein